MKCIECDSCHKIKITKYPAGTGEPYVKTKYMCYGVKEPFEILDVNQECTEYPEIKDETVEDKNIINGVYIRSMNDEELSEFLMSEWFKDDICKNCEGEYDRCGDLKFCESKILEWLKKKKA